MPVVELGFTTKIRTCMSPNLLAIAAMEYQPPWESIHEKPEQNLQWFEYSTNVL
jgi:hypothetical protein